MTPRLADPLRVLVVDDSAYNRQIIASLLESFPDVEVAGRAGNGYQALRLALELDPDVITLDLEMPEMDGFGFLRVLMQRRPIPVVVVSGYANRENVFRALECGALDFVAKPSSEGGRALATIEQELQAKMEMVRRLRAVRLRARTQTLQEVPRARPAGLALASRTAANAGAPTCLVAIAASTGGPPAVQHLLSRLPGDLPAAVVIAQHMPPRFTKAFAERVDRLVALRVVEAQDGMSLERGTAYIAQGGTNLRVEAQGSSAVLRVVVVDPTPAVIVPSADYLFRAAAEVFGDRLCVAVLTGMGVDGRDGAIVAKAHGARVLAEEPGEAVMPGMPQATIDAGVADEVCPLEQLSASILRFIRRR